MSKKKKKKRFRKSGKQVWVCSRCHPNLDKYDLLIDLASIHHVSRKMYETGKISKKVLKKWKAREAKYLSNTKYDSCKHNWLPQTVFPSKRKKTTHIGWCCFKCHTWTNSVHIDDISNTFKFHPYLSRTHGKIEDVY